MKLLGGQTIQLPTRERFNEDVEEVVEEIKDKQSETKYTLKPANIGALAVASEHESVRSGKSKRTMTGSELQNFFQKGREEIKSKYSHPESVKSKVSSYRAKLLRKLEAQITNENTMDD